ncbi:MAG: hypothetical protein GTN62_11895 [Gemmatimonadales bacterium]|nr:hypothetical protein [Gemmatimonadales bacterium]NIN12421.1 hypothetical protein [Gemmatimonadales bacterium]NIN50797.1 hypothetical protein [Gemmatimonadales bacterium]NIP08261.1 hypothetical protein [Gemmatimonadales bacterium]NIR00785.1 hypothetical protein [Gemmatimonadales bacterium]
MTLVIAHRGASAYEVENSLAAFRAASAMGADGVELDVHVTADGVPVVHHDPAAGPRLIAAVDYQDLTGYRLSNGEPVPTLAQALGVMGPDLSVFVEVKSLAPEHDAVLLDVLDRGPHPARYQVHSFDHRIVQRLHAQRPALPGGILSSSYPILPFAPLEQVGAAVLWQQESLIDRDLVRGAHERGYQLYAWTVDEPERMRLLIEMEVDALCTNRPDVGRRVVG